jgi:hypothetical protein
MKILITGRGGAASWTIRGEQIGRALGATVKPHATVQDIRAHDVVLVVKRVPDELLQALRRADRPWVYDIVDAYPQKLGGFMGRAEAVNWARDWIAHLEPTSVIWPNERMRQDLHATGAVVYHHARPGIAPNPIRERILTVGYEGRATYLEGWHDAIERECKRIGATFNPAPLKLADVDVLLALRGPQWRSYPSIHWKSNVKLANAQASGTPIICNREDGYIETHTSGEYWCDTPEELRQSFDWLESQQARQGAALWLRTKQWPVEEAAEQVREVLRRAM